jgi:hypothetical protein
MIVSSILPDGHTEPAELYECTEVRQRTGAILCRHIDDASMIEPDGV